MKKFKFRLAKVLKAKEIKEKLKLKEIMKIEQALIKQREIINETDILLNKTIKTIVTQRSGISKSIVLRHTLAYEERLNLEKNNQMRLIMESEKGLKKLREELLEINRERKTLDKLKSNQKEDYLSAYNKIEQLKMDDIASKRRGILFPFNTVIEENIA